MNASADGKEVKIVGELKFDKNLSNGGSAGNLEKWLFKDDLGYVWLKGRSRDDTFEPEAEVCAYRLACLLGVPAIPYALFQIPKLSHKELCICRDYSRGYVVISLYDYVSYAANVEFAKLLDGKEKFRLVESVLSEQAKKLHRAILLFDYIIGNPDRHLRNFDVRLNKDGKFHSLVEMYDNGAGLFSDQNVKNIKKESKNKSNYVHSKPYFDPHLSQLNMIPELSDRSLLNPVKAVDIYKIIENYFEGERAFFLNKYIVNNLERLGLLCH